MNKLEDTE